MMLTLDIVFNTRTERYLGIFPANDVIHNFGFLTICSKDRPGLD